MRAAWQCDCQGPPGAPAEEAHVEASRRVIAAATRETARIPTCPWRALEDPYVRAVLDAHRSCSTGDGNASPALLMPADPPPHIWEGLHHYLYLIRKLRADEAERQRQKAQRGRPDRVPGTRRH